MAELDPGSLEHQAYRDQLEAWSAFCPQSSKLKAILRYVRSGRIVQDLRGTGVLVAEPSGGLETQWADGLSPLAKLLTADSKTKERDQGSALIRWRVEGADTLETAVWSDVQLQREWSAFNATLGDMRGLCLSSGKEEPLAFNHPRRLRHGGDGAKLISANDASGYTYRGRFVGAEEAYGLGSASTQRAHNALRWLIDRQGNKHGDQVVVAWAIGGEPIPAPVSNSLELLSEEGDDDLFLPLGLAALPATPAVSVGDAGQAFARRMNKRIQGYRAKLGARDGVVVMALDSATPGRMAILYYRELRGSEFLDRIERWHDALAWPQNFGKDLHFVGTPSPRDIAEAAYGRRVDDKLRKATVERLLPCIVDGRPLPRDLEQSVVRRATNRAGLERWEFERTLGIACSLVRGRYPEERYTMSLEEDRKTRDYLYGRLLALADSIEEIALNVAGEGRETNAARLMQRFADHPATTWRTLELQLRPYISRLRSSRPGALAIRQRLLDELISSFPSTDDGSNTFNENHRLSGEFLLAFHSQREALRHKKVPATTGNPGEQE